MVQGSVARHQPTGLGQQAESGSSPRMSRRGERGSRVPTEAGWASRIAGRCGFRIGKADFEPRVNRPQGVPPRGPNRAQPEGAAASGNSGQALNRCRERFPA